MVHAETPGRDRPQYVAAVLVAYRSTPGTIGHVRASDRKLAHHLFDSRVPLEVVRAALVLAALRRGCRADDADPLEPVRSLHYFKPVIAEVLKLPLNSAYFKYLEVRLRDYTAAESPPSADRPPLD